MPLDGSVARKELVDAEGKLKHKIGDRLDLYLVRMQGPVKLLSTSPLAKSHVEDLAEAYPSGLPIEGKVSEVCNGGVRVSIRGKSAFCPIGQLDIARVESAEGFVGQKLDFLVSEISEGGRNIVVSRRKLLQQQRAISEKSFIKNTREGDVVEGEVKKIESFGGLCGNCAGDRRGCCIFRS